MPSDRFIPCREIVAVYRLTAGLPVRIQLGPVRFTIGLDISETPPFLDSWLRRDNEDTGLWLARYETIEHAWFHFGNGYEVECPSLLERLFAQLVAEGRAECVAGRHIELRWIVNGPPDEAPLDVYYSWRFSPWHAAAEHCVFARSWMADFDARI